MGVEVTRVTYRAECELTIITIDGQERDSYFVCKSGGKGFLYAKGGAVEYFTIPEKEETEEKEEEEAGE